LEPTLLAGEFEACEIVACYDIIVPAGREPTLSARVQSK